MPGDGHCLYRAVGKVVGMPPGDLIQIVTIMAEEHCRRQTMSIYTSSEARALAERLTSWAQLEENVNGREHVQWSGNDELKLLAMALERPIVVINAGVGGTEKWEHTLITPRTKVNGQFTRTIVTVPQRNRRRHVVSRRRSNTQLQQTQQHLECCRPIYLLYQDE